MPKDSLGEAIVTKPTSAAPIAAAGSKNFNEEFKRDFVKEGFLKLEQGIDRFSAQLAAAGRLWQKIQLRWDALKQEQLRQYPGPEALIISSDQPYASPNQIPRPAWQLESAKTKDPLQALRASYLTPEHLTQEPVYFPKRLDEWQRSQSIEKGVFKRLVRPYLDPDAFTRYETEREVLAAAKTKEKEELIKEREGQRRSQQERRRQAPYDKLKKRLEHWQHLGFQVLEQAPERCILEKRYRWQDFKDAWKVLEEKPAWHLQGLAFLTCAFHPYTRIGLGIEQGRFQERQIDSVNIKLLKTLLATMLAAAALGLLVYNHVPQTLWQCGQRSAGAARLLYTQARYAVIIRWPRPQGLPITYATKATEHVAASGGAHGAGTPAGEKIRIVAGIDDELSKDVFELVARDLWKKYQVRYSQVEIALYYKRHLGQSVPYYIMQWGEKNSLHEPLITVNRWTPEFYDSFKR